MPRYSTVPLTASDLTDFIAAESDFALEMATLRELRALGFEAEHAAAYVDPVTQKMRAYDIRARHIDSTRSFRFAVECKNLNPGSPLLVHATPRLQSEAYHTVVRHRTINGYPFVETSRRGTVYRLGASVGRQTDQPSKDEKGNFRSSDAPTYEKWLQAVNGCLDLVKELASVHSQDEHLGAIVPLLVVPADTLWQVDYGDDGSVATPVRIVEEATLILRHSWSAQAAMSALTFDISHLEIVTLTRLAARVRELVGVHGLL